MIVRRIGQRSGIEARNTSARGAVFVAAWLCALLAITGCNGGRKPGTARLEGNITVDGQPPPEGAIGSISFRPSGKGQPTSAQIVDGKYKCDDVPVGELVVFVQLVQPTGKMVSEGGRSYPELRNLVSSKYDRILSWPVTPSRNNRVGTLFDRFVRPQRRDVVAPTTSDGIGGGGLSHDES
jgi:hypothetical protein